MITSANNTQIRHIQLLAKKAKARRDEGLFLVEGPRMFYEAPPERIERAYLSESFYRGMEDRRMLDRIPWELVADHVFARAAETVHSQGVLCVMRGMGYRMPELLQKKDPLLLLLEDLQDPGNVGTIFRTAEGAGADGIILTKNCVDIYNPKTIRSTMGSVYRMPFVCLESEDLSHVLGAFKEKGVAVCAAHLEGKRAYDREDYTGGTVFLIGNEGNGLSADLAEAADKKVRIPMEGRLESLNAGVAAAVLLYEAYRQRRGGFPS